MYRSSFRVRAGAAFAALALAFVAPGVSRGADDPPTAADHEQRIRELEETIRELNKDTRKLTAAEETRAAAKPTAGWSLKDGFFLQTQDGSYKLRVGGYTHFDGRFFLEEENRGSTTSFAFRRVRPEFRGTVAKYFEFRLLPDFAGSTLVLQDAYVEAKYWRQIALRAGKFKTPYGIERLQSATAITFVERAISDNLVPNRDLGVVLFGELFLGTLTYEGGIFNGVVDGSSGDVNPGDDFDFAGRIFAYPFKNSTIEQARGLGIGFAGTYGRENASTSSPALPAYRPSGRGNPFFRYVNTAATATAPANIAVADGVHYRYSPQGTFYWGPFGLLTEYNVSAQNVENGGVEDLVTNSAWQVATSFVLTGENASYKGVVPNQPFNPFTGTWGAFEIAFRYAQLDVDDDAFDKGFADPKRAAEKAQEFTVGANWYLNSNIKLALNYDRTWYEDGEGTGDLDTENLFLTRVQLVF
jgi:phosphate-selective porin OprO/OprP